MRELVVTGDRLASALEYLPGPGVFELDNQLYAAHTGYVETAFNDTEMTVFPVTSVPLEFNEGDQILGRIHMLKNKSAVVQIVRIKGESRDIDTWEEGTLHISKMASNYVEDVRYEFQPNDLIQARILKYDNQIELTTGEPEGGVIWGACSVCGLAPLERRENHLWCSDCKQNEARNLSSDYGSIRV